MESDQWHSEEGFIEEAVRQLQRAVAAKKCWCCGCLHNLVASIEKNWLEEKQPPVLVEALRAAKDHLTDLEYSCFGCEICYPALVTNAVNQGLKDQEFDFESCPAVEEVIRDGWLPLPGNYTVRGYLAPVAICTLTDENLSGNIARQTGPETSIVGTLQTENLGIERLIMNVIANPHLRFLVICGADSRQAVGHLPGQSLMSLMQSGLDENSRIIGAKGKRPFLKNTSREMVDYFRRKMEVVDLIGNSEVTTILKKAEALAARNPGHVEPFGTLDLVSPVFGYLPTKMVTDPAGYFVIHLDRPKGLIWLEHYRNEGVLDIIIQGSRPAEIYTPAVERELVSRLDHAAYLGMELARAEEALLSGTPYTQDAAPEQDVLNLRASFGCGPSCECERNKS